MSDARFLTIPDACTRLCCARSTFYAEYVRTGKLTLVTRGRRRLLFAPQVERLILDEAKAAGIDTAGVTVPPPPSPAVP